MFRRIATITATTLMLVALTAAPALGWGNGGGAGGGDGYGTHDWVLDHAINMAGADASWVDLRTALLASDDPDYAPTLTPKGWHTYKEYGSARGAPQAVADEYYQVVTAYNRGDYTQASLHLGRMSHYYSDITQPYHDTVKGSQSRNPRHYAYEIAVTKLTSPYTMNAGWLSRQTPENVTDVRAFTVRAALYGRSKYSALDSSYKASGRVTGSAATITAAMLNRAANDLADIIRAVPKGEGLAKSPTVLKNKMTKMTYQFPRRGTSGSDSIRTEASCFDAAGKPMAGVGVRFTWPFASGSKSFIAYTDSNGMAYNWQPPGTKIALMRRRTITASTKLSGETTASTTWFMPTPRLASGASGFSTSISSTRPSVGATVKARARVRNAAGNPVAGLPVIFSWSFKSKTVRVTAITNSKGYAYSSQPVSGPKGYRVLVMARAWAARLGHSSSASFVPR